MRSHGRWFPNRCGGCRLQGRTQRLGLLRRGEVVFLLHGRLRWHFDRMHLRGGVECLWRHLSDGDGGEGR